ncbi:MAG: response regulator, partial [Saprospiraceae bacterium]
FELEVAVEDILDLLSVKANIKQLNLWYYIDRKIAPLIVGDVTRLKQILTNLIGNAIKFTDKGQITTEVTLVQETSKTIELQFKVIDTGIGIPPSKQHDLFAEFKQVDSSTTRKYGGTGLGLTISQRLVKMMQGQIWVESDGLKGSTFIFTAKFKKNNNELQQAYYQDEMAIMSQKNILLIADNDRLIDLIKYHTDYWQSNLTIATSVSEMLAMVQNQYDLILIYERLRGVSGIALEKRIRFTAQGKHIPIIILSTTHFESSKANHHVYTAFVNNPLKISNLRHSIKTLVLPKNKAEHYKEILKKETEILGQKLPLKILIAEDHPINQRLVLFLLKKQGYQADAVGNGQEAIEAIEQQRYDILFMDVQMPELDGLEATRRIVKKYPNIPDRPVIIAMTANAMQGDRERCLGAGMDDYVSKPLKPGIVVEMLTKWGTRLKIKE